MQDFLRLKDVSYSCSRIFSGERWALTGEAGVFLDPFYSPGSDFIALNNVYIGELIRRDFGGSLSNPGVIIKEDRRGDAEDKNRENQRNIEYA